jgi:hypothetical protein
MSGSNGAGLTLRAALASHRWKTRGDEVERDDLGTGGSALGGEQSEGRGAESGPTDHDRRKHDGDQRPT